MRTDAPDLVTMPMCPHVPVPSSRKPMPCIFDFAFRVRPRVWAPGKSFPGCAFTRSIGDSVAEGIGVTAEPELLRKELTEEDQARIPAIYILNN